MDDSFVVDERVKVNADDKVAYDEAEEADT